MHNKSVNSLVQRWIKAQGKNKCSFIVLFDITKYQIKLMKVKARIINNDYKDPQRFWRNSTPFKYTIKDFSV